MYVGLELSMRKTFTDYLDDVSGTYTNQDVMLQERGEVAAALSNRSIGGERKVGSDRGNSTQNDNYSFAQLTISYRIGHKLARQGGNLMAVLKNSYRAGKCPTFDKG
jgi:hypothetical protein